MAGERPLQGGDLLAGDPLAAQRNDLIDHLGGGGAGQAMGTRAAIGEPGVPFAAIARQPLGAVRSETARAVATARAVCPSVITRRTISARL